MKAFGRGIIVHVWRQRPKGKGRWFYGGAYEYGEEPPRYPVPALPSYMFVDALGLRIAELRQGEYGYGWYYLNW